MKDQSTQTPYFNRYTKGPYDLRFVRGSGNFVCQVYEDGAILDTLRHTNLDQLNKKIERYLSAQSTDSEVVRLKADLSKSQKQVAALTKTLNEVGDGNAKAAQLEQDLGTANQKLKDLQKSFDKSQSDVDQYKSEIEKLKAGDAATK